MVPAYPSMTPQATMVAVGALALGLGSCSFLHRSGLKGHLAATGEPVLGVLWYLDSSYRSVHVSLVDARKDLYCTGAMRLEQEPIRIGMFAFTNAEYGGELLCSTGEVAKLRFVSSDVSANGVDGRGSGTIGSREFSFEIADDVGCRSEGCLAVSGTTEHAGISRLRKAHGLPPVGKQ